MDVTLGCDYLKYYRRNKSVPEVHPTWRRASGAVAFVPSHRSLAHPIISEGGTACYGNTGSGFAIISKQSNNTWKAMLSSTGIPAFLKTKGVNGWPDIEIGGPGFCFSVWRWNGKSYEINRYEYEGKSCKIN